MTPVSFPYVEVSFKTALTEVLNPYLTTGLTNSVGGVSLDFYQCEVHNNVDLVRAPSTMPRIGIVGTRSNPIKDEKCIDPLGNMPIGYVRRESIFRSVYISAPRELQIQSPPYLESFKHKIDWRDMDRIWSQVHAVFSTKLSDFNIRNIFRPSLTSSPTVANDADYLILYGTLICEIRFNFARG